MFFVKNQRQLLTLTFLDKFLIYVIFSILLCLLSVRLYSPSFCSLCSRWTATTKWSYFLNNTVLVTFWRGLFHTSLKFIICSRCLSVLPTLTDSNTGKSQGTGKWGFPFVDAEESYFSLPHCCCIASRILIHSVNCLYCFIKNIYIKSF